MNESFRGHRINLSAVTGLSVDNNFDYLIYNTLIKNFLFTFLTSIHRIIFY